MEPSQDLAGLVIHMDLNILPGAVKKQLEHHELKFGVLNHTLHSAGRANGMICWPVLAGMAVFSV